MKKIKFTKEEQEVMSLLGEEGIYLNFGDKEHERLKPAMSELFFRGLIDRGDRAVNHIVLNGLGKKAIEWNYSTDFINNLKIKNGTNKPTE